MPSKRQLAAIMFTDISGFSAMMQEDEVYAKTILSRQRKVIEAKHGDFDGKILQYVGDGTLSIFGSAVSAVECAVAIQVELRKDPYVPLRIGLHTGDITYDDTGAFGDGVNVTSRIERLCIPGAVYVSDKVYDDIKNHAWLKAMRLGSFKLHNISSNMDIYAITSKGLILPDDADLEQLPEFGDAGHDIPRGRKRKMVAAFLALFFGIFGVHRFYLGQRGKGIAFLAAFGIAMMATIQEDLPIMGIVAIVAFVDAVLLFAMPKEDFDFKYNQGKAVKTRPRKKRIREQLFPKMRRDIPWSDSSLQTAMNKGKNLFIKGRWEEAIRCFDEVLEIDEEHPEAHYYLASCFSLMKDEENAYIHLALAVKNGFKDFKKIETDLNLYYLRSLASYPGFVSNGYRLVGALPEPQKGLLDSDRFDPLILDKIELLGEKLERGELTQEEFQLKKEKILRGES